MELYNVEAWSIFCFVSLINFEVSSIGEIIVLSSANIMQVLFFVSWFGKEQIENKADLRRTHAEFLG